MRKSMHTLMLGMTMAMMGGMSGPGESYHEPWRDRRKPEPRKFPLPVSDTLTDKGRKLIALGLQKEDNGKRYTYDINISFATQKAFTKRMVKVQAEFSAAISFNKEEYLLKNGVRIEELPKEQL
jgi:hypothetical protein